MMMMNCFCGMIDRRKAFSLISSRDHCQRSLPSRISDTPRAGFEPAQNLSSGFVEWNCAVVITTTLRLHIVACILLLLPLQQFYITKMMMLIFFVIVMRLHLYSMCLFYWFLNNTSFKEHISVIASDCSICYTGNDLNYVQCLYIAPMVKAWFMAPMECNSNEKGMVLWKIDFRKRNRHGKSQKIQ